MFRISLVLSILFNLGCSDSLSSTPPYMVVLDAGSSGTRVYVYQILSPGSSSEPPSVKKIASCKDPDPNCKQTTTKDTGIAALAGKTQSEMNTYLAPLINYATKALTNRISKIPLTLMATAGVRNLSPVSNQATLMDSATTTLSQAGYKSGKALVLSGFAEGVYAWLNANAALETLGKPWEQTYGIIEMGGASEQITFIPSAQANSFPVSIAGQNYSLYSYSYNHLGSNDASKTTSSSGSELSGCSSSKSDYETCKSSWAAVLNENFACTPLCGLLGINQPEIPVSMNFKMVGGVPSGISQACSVSPYMPTTIDNLGKKICSNSPSTCSGYKGDPKYFCKLLALLSTELAGAGTEFSGFGFSQSSTQVQAVDSDGTINGQEATWTLGFAIGELLGIAPHSFTGQ